MTEFEVMLYVYDTSQGMAKQLSQQFVGKYFEGVWHTGIVVYGQEYFFDGGGIMCDKPGQTPFGVPLKRLPLGKTSLPREFFEEFLQQLAPRYLPECYHVFDNNCNNFTDECCIFLVNKRIPSHITGLPEELLATPLGRQFAPMIEQMSGIGT